MRQHLIHVQWQDIGPEDFGHLRPIARVAPPQVWLLLDPPKPFQPKPLERERCTLDAAASHVDHSAEMTDDRRAQSHAVALNPSLPLLCTQRQDDEVRIGLVDPVNLLAGTQAIEMPITRRVETDTTHPPTLRVHSRTRLLGNAIGSTEKVHLDGPSGMARAQSLEQSGPGDALRESHPQQLRNPDNRHPVSQGKLAVDNRLAKGWILARCDDEIDVCRRHHEPTSGSRSLLHHVAGFICTDLIERQPQQADHVSVEVDPCPSWSSRCEVDRLRLCRFGFHACDA
jgi:hypothetical protein